MEHNQEDQEAQGHPLSSIKKTQIFMGILLPFKNPLEIRKSFYVNLLFDVG